MKHYLMLLIAVLVLAACSGEETPNEAEQQENKQEETQEEATMNKELSQAMTDKYKELYPDDKYVQSIEVWEKYGVIRVKTAPIPKDKEELTANTVGTVWYQHFKDKFTPKQTEIWADGAHVHTTFDPRFKD